MSPDLLQLHEGALFIGDAHYSPKNPGLLPFLKAIASGEIETPQLILMGDIFDQLIGGISYTLERNAEAVALIDEIALKIDVIYLEGNHDFQLASVLKNTHVFTIAEQPLRCQYADKEVLLAHGDLGLGWGYGLYTYLIRKRPILRLLRVIDSFTDHSIVHSIDRHNAKKEDCDQFDGFESYTKRRLASTDLSSSTYYIDGHYHQNRIFDIEGCTYINLAAFSCNQRYFQLQLSNNQKLLKEVTFSKES